MSQHEPIVVVGAGLGGLTLARTLHVHGIEAAVYELDASAGARDQGGMLDMHAESGQAALRAAGLTERFQGIIHAGGEATRVLGKDGSLRYADGGGGGRPEVDRNDLRRILLDSLPDGAVRWGAKVVAVRPLGDGCHEIGFADGDVVTTDLLVGADGAWSKVRPLVSAAVPDYSGISFVEADLRDAAVRHPDTAELVGGGSMFALADEKGLLTHSETDSSVHAYIALKVPVDWLTGIDFADTDAAKAVLLECFAGWDKRLLALIADADGALVGRLIDALPVGHRWSRVPGVTLLGDAAHLMTPFAGEGANLAMLDGAELATAIAAYPGDAETALADYEQRMFARSEAAAAESAANLVMLFGPGAVDRLVEQFGGAERD